MVLIIHIATFRSISVERGAWQMHWVGGCMFLKALLWQVSDKADQHPQIQVRLIAQAHCRLVRGPDWDRQTCQLLTKAMRCYNVRQFPGRVT